jgi:hypothetical protein
VSRPRGYIAHYRPRPSTRALLDNVQAVLAEYRDALPLTCRQVFYRLVGKYDYDKTEDAYARLCEHMSNARRARLIPFDSIRDDGVLGGPPAAHYADASEFWSVVQAEARRATLDVLITQRIYVELLCEAGGMVPQLRRVADRFSVPVYSSGGFDSLTAKRSIVERIVQSGRPAIVLHLGDFDPSGVSIFDVLTEDVTAFLSEDEPGLSVEFVRLALTAEQIREYELPTAPPKRSDSRSAGWTETCQLEALPPDELAAITRTALERHLDMNRVRDRWAESEQFRNTLTDRISGIEAA